MDSNINSRFEKAINNMEQKFTNVRAGRANPSMLDSVMVNYYGSITPLRSVANISIKEARQLVIKPFDKSALGAIEKAIFEANIGVTPNNNGEAIFIVIPALTEERRKEYVKQVRAIAEEAKIAIRNIRQDGINEVKKLEFSTDEEKRMIDDIQDEVNTYNKKVEELLKLKEEELLHL